MAERLLCKQEVIGSIPIASRPGLAGLGLVWLGLALAFAWLPWDRSLDQPGRARPRERGAAWHGLRVALRAGPRAAVVLWRCESGSGAPLGAQGDSVGPCLAWRASAGLGLGPWGSPSAPCALVWPEGIVARERQGSSSGWRWQGPGALACVLLRMRLALRRGQGRLLAGGASFRPGRDGSCAWREPGHAFCRGMASALSVIRAFGGCLGARRR